jgi:hypothetical protein
MELLFSYVHARGSCVPTHKGNECVELSKTVSIGITSHSREANRSFIQMAYVTRDMRLSSCPILGHKVIRPVKPGSGSKLGKLRLRHIRIVVYPVPLQGVPKRTIQLYRGLLPSQLSCDLGCLSLRQITLLLDYSKSCGEASAKLFRLGTDKLLL